MEHKSHIGYYDFWKGIAIVMVVAIHTSCGFDFTSIHGNIRIVLRILMNSAVPIFLAISGFFLAKKHLVKLVDFKEFWKKQIPKVYIPMLFWSVPLFLMSLFSNETNIIKSFVKLLLGGYSVYYFIVLIIQCYFLLPLIRRYKKFFLYISFILTTLSWWAIVYKLPGLPLLLYAGPFVCWIFYFVLGVYLSEKKCDYSIFIPILLIFIGLAMQYTESYVLFSSGRMSLGQKCSAVVANSGVILFMLSNRVRSCYKANKFERTFEHIGYNSFGIYLVHCYFILLLSNIYELRSWSIRCFVIFCISFLFVKILRCILSRNIIGKLCGITK